MMDTFEIVSEWSLHGSRRTIRCLRCGAEHTEHHTGYAPPEPGAMHIGDGVVVTATPHTEDTP